MKQIDCRDGTEWRKWLERNSHKETEIWLKFYKNEKKNDSIDYETAVNQALCYGWIDSIIKKIDETLYVRKFTPRKETSKWSETNKKRVRNLISEGIMTEKGLSLIEAAKRNGSWNKEERQKRLKTEPK